MSIQQPITGTRGKAIVEPATVIQERAKHGLAPTSTIPLAQIICYDTWLWQWVCTLPDRVECDGWLKGSFLMSAGDTQVLVMKATGVGSPTAVMTLEELIASGVTRLVSLGAAGGLQPDLSVGDVVVCERAIRDEGTSLHYLPPAKYAEPDHALTDRLCAAIGAQDIAFTRGTSWTTDAPYRETLEDLLRYRAEGVATVEMEASALFSVGAYRKVQVCSLFSISDKLDEQGWHQGYLSEAKTESLKRIFQAALTMLSEPAAHGSERP